MGADHDVYEASRQHGGNIVADALALRADEERDGQPAVEAGDVEGLDVAARGLEARPIEQPAHSEEVLLGEYFGGRHERRLRSAARGGEHGGCGYDGLAAADVALQEAAHRPVGLDICQDVRQGASLRRG